MSKILIAYFSATGETARLANTIAEVTGGILHEILPAKPYTESDLDWRDKNSRSSIEMNDRSFRPEIANRVENMEQFDVIFVGFPIWWYTAPTIINTFLESYDFTGKTVIPFATSGGSGMGKTESLLQKSCSAHTKWLPGKKMSSRESITSVKKWTDTLYI